MGTPHKRKFKKPPEGQDLLMTPEEVAELLQFNINQIYKLNAKGLPQFKIGKHSRYLYSEVMTWVMNQDTRIKDDSSLHRDYTFEELPKCWPLVENVTEDKVA